MKNKLFQIPQNCRAYINLGVYIYIYVYGGFPKLGVPNSWMVYIRMDDLGVPLFQESVIYIYIYIYICFHT